MSEDPARIPLFPLQTVVLFPDVRVPLHVFEPRYRQMMKDAVEIGRCIGMSVVLPQHAGDMSGAPPLFDVGCAGIIESYEALPDGRYNLLLLGTHRFRINREISNEKLYRSAEVELLSESSDDVDAEQRESLMELLRQLLARNAPDQASEFDAAGLGEVDDVTFVNSLCQSLDLEVVEKQTLLEANGVSDRCARLIEMLRFRLAATAPTGGHGSSSIH